jgi:hypothetical protein
VIRGVAVEKLAHSEFQKIGSRQEALQAIFPTLLDIFYHPIFDFFQKNRLFQQPQDFSTPTFSAPATRPMLAPRHHGGREQMAASKCDALVSA